MIATEELRPAYDSAVADLRDVPLGDLVLLSPGPGCSQPREGAAGPGGYPGLRWPLSSRRSRAHVRPGMPLTSERHGAGRVGGFRQQRGTANRSRHLRGLLARARGACAGRATGSGRGSRSPRRCRKGPAPAAHSSPHRPVSWRLMRFPFARETPCTCRVGHLLRRRRCYRDFVGLAHQAAPSSGGCPARWQYGHLRRGGRGAGTRGSWPGTFRRGGGHRATSRPVAAVALLAAGQSRLRASPRQESCG